MPVMKELFGVECARCREAGHRCQAQIRLDGIALCLRCANDEPCIYVTAARDYRPAASSDPCVIPEMTREDRLAIRTMPRLPSIHATNGIDEINRETREEIATDRKRSAAQLAQKYHIPEETVRNIRRRYKRTQLIRGRALAPVPKQIGGENVVIAPMAVLGAEMLAAREDEISERAKKKDLKTDADHVSV